MSQLLKEYAASVVWKFTPEKYRTLIKWQNIWNKNAVTDPERHKVLQLAGPWLPLSKHACYYTELSEGREESRATGSKVTQTVAEPEGQLMPVAAVPVQKKKFKNKSIHMVRDEEETLKARGRDRPRHNHPISIHGWALRYTKRWQLPVWWALLPWQLDAGISWQMVQWSQAVRIPVQECRYWPGDLEKTRNSQPLEVTLVKSDGEVIFAWIIF